MIQEIAPHRFDNAYKPRNARENDYILFVRENQMLLLFENNQNRNLSYKDLLQYWEPEQIKLHYLFAIDEKAYYLLENDEIPEILNARLRDSGFFRSLTPRHMAFANITGMQLERWMRGRKYCGSCGNLMNHSEKEQALICPTCGCIEYPKISPAVIVAITDNDKLLLTKYAYGEYRRYALVAGFVEVGESFEEAVKREVLEEVGLYIKNITYYKSQPWAFSDSEMIGFFAELEGDNKITLQEEELAEAVWLKKEEIPESVNDISIGQEMIELFRNK